MVLEVKSRYLWGRGRLVMAKVHETASAGEACSLLTLHGDYTWVFIF